MLTQGFHEQIKNKRKLKRITGILSVVAMAGVALVLVRSKSASKTIFFFVIFSTFDFG
jgi:hypothetical protein